MPIAGCTPASGADMTPASAGEPDAQRKDGGQRRLQADAHGAHHLRVAHAGAHDHAERSLVEQQPAAGHGQNRNSQDRQPIVGVDEIADDAAGRAARPESRRAGRSCPRSCAALCSAAIARPNVNSSPSAGSLLYRRRRNSRSISDADAAQPPTGESDHGAEEAQPLLDLVGEIGAQRVERAVGEVDHAAQAEDQRQPERQDDVERARPAGR